MKKILGLVLIAILAVTSASASADDDAAKIEKKYTKALKVFKDSERAGPFFEKSYGYALFPTVGKGGFGLGGAHGKGRVYVNGKYVADTSLSQFTVGFQAGIQAYSQIMFFKDEAAYITFSRGNFELGAQATAVAITSGVSADADYDKGIIIFTAAKGGLMYEASVGGQKFDYEPLEK